MIEKILPYGIAFLGAFVLTLILTPIVREVNRKLGMVDKPDPRRINKVPIPRGGGVALFLGAVGSYLIFIHCEGMPWLPASAVHHTAKLPLLATAIFLIGLWDDKFGMPPKVKLLGQLIVAFLVWFWADLGFHHIWPSIPMWIDAVLTVFWIAGAINAFNLIDGLDGLASGLALIATLGMAGALMFSGHADYTYFHLAFAGALLGFLRYNYNPASVFLGDSGSMLIGFTVSVMALSAQATNSFIVSVGVPLLAMGVPIFDTILAILRRSVRRLIRLSEEDEALAAGDSDQVMTADHDHLHHRILRAVNFNQRKAAWTLYLIALFFVGVGVVGTVFKSRAAGFWIVAVAVGAVVIFKNMARIEFFDTGRLLSVIAHDPESGSRRILARLSPPLHMLADVIVLVIAFFTLFAIMQFGVDSKILRMSLPVRVISTFVMLFAFHAYSTVWARAMISNFFRLGIGCAAGAMLGSLVLYYLPEVHPVKLASATAVYFTVSFVLLVAVRMLRPFVRDVFYALDCSRMKLRKDVSRVLVYGTGLRYRSFRRELVRNASDNDRVIVGLVDDDPLLEGHYIGTFRVLGSLAKAPEIINELNVDTVVLACEITDEQREKIIDTLKPTGVKIVQFTFMEKEL